MISLIVPTRNRAYTLRKVLRSYFEQEGISEIVLVIDAGEDDTESVFAEIGADFPNTRRVVVRNAARLGASASRNRGVEAATNEFVMFCDDDEFLEAGYAATCHRILVDRGAGAVSGRRVYMMEGETPGDALRRFGNGVRRAKPFSYWFCELRNAAKFDGDVRLPFTNAIIVTRRDSVRTFGFDDHYSKGNGYREETDFQMNLFVNGLDIWMSNAVHSIHLPFSEVHTGGQRTSSFRRIYWMVKYTNYFYNKYYDRYRSKTRVPMPKPLAKAVYAVFACYRELLHPTVYKVARYFYYKMGRSPGGSAVPVKQ